MKDEDPAQPTIDDRGIPWLTDPQRDFIAHLTTVCILGQIQSKGLKGPQTYASVSDALGQIAEDGEIDLRADDRNIWVIICGRPMVHCERDWLEWASAKWNTAPRN
jgi:hypothetical protein